MSDPKQYDDVIGMLTDQCHQYALEVERLKAAPHDDDTCPHLVVLGRLEAENARLKAEVERLTAFTTRTIIPNEELQKQIERLIKAGNMINVTLNAYYNGWPYDLLIVRDVMLRWDAAKEGKQP